MQDPALNTEIRVTPVFSSPPASAQPKMCIDTSSPSIYSSPALNAGGALDVVVVEHPDGTLLSSAWFVVFDAAATGRVGVHINGSSFIDASRSDLHVGIQREPASFAAADSQTSSTEASVPSAALLAALSASKLLRSGRNEVRYSLGGPGGACVRAFLFLWRASVPAVIFDIDGTVTLNDAAGHAANLLPGDASPTHPGICQLVCELHARGYAVIFLTSRPLLGAAGIERTRRFLFEVAVDQPSAFRMPPAPVFTTTHRDMFAALVDELSGKSKAFKANSLKPLRQAFEAPASARTLGGVLSGAIGEISSKLSSLGVLPASTGGGLFAGFGNREKDALAYLSAGVPPERVFLIDTTSKVAGRANVIGGHDVEHGAPSSPAAGDAKAAPPSWRSYTGMLASGAIEAYFPRRVSQDEQQNTMHACAPLSTGRSVR